MNKKKKRAEEAGWATAHFPALGHDTMCCIVTAMAWAHMARHDTAGQARWGVQQALRHGQPALRHSRPARSLATGVCRDTIVCIMTEGRPCVSTQRATRRPAPSDTV